MKSLIKKIIFLVLLVIILAGGLKSYSLFAQSGPAGELPVYTKLFNKLYFGTASSATADELLQLDTISEDILPFNPGDIASDAPGGNPSPARYDVSNLGGNRSACIPENVKTGITYGANSNCTGTLSTTGYFKIGPDSPSLTNYCASVDTSIPSSNIEVMAVKCRYVASCGPGGSSIGYYGNGTWCEAGMRCLSGVCNWYQYRIVEYNIEGHYRPAGEPYCTMKNGVYNGPYSWAAPGTFIYDTNPNLDGTIVRGQGWSCWADGSWQCWQNKDRCHGINIRYLQRWHW